MSAPPCKKVKSPPEIAAEVRRALIEASVSAVGIRHGMKTVALDCLQECAMGLRDCQECLKRTLGETLREADQTHDLIRRQLMASVVNQLGDAAYLASQIEPESERDYQPSIGDSESTPRGDSPVNLPVSRPVSSVVPTVAKTQQAPIAGAPTPCPPPCPPNVTLIESTDPLWGSMMAWADGWLRLLSDCNLWNPQAWHSTDCGKKYLEATADSLGEAWRSYLDNGTDQVALSKLNDSIKESV